MVKRVLNLFNDDHKALVVLLVSIDKETSPGLMTTTRQRTDNYNLVRDTTMALQEAVRDCKSFDEVVSTVSNFPNAKEGEGIQFLFGRVYDQSVKLKKAVEEAQLQGENEFVNSFGYKINNMPYQKIVFAEKAVQEAAVA